MFRPRTDLTIAQKVEDETKREIVGGRQNKCVGQTSLNKDLRTVLVLVLTRDRALNYLSSFTPHDLCLKAYVGSPFVYG